MSPLSSTENRVLTSQAREALRGKWGLGVGTAAVVFLLMVVLQFLFIVISISIAGPSASEESLKLFTNIINILLSILIDGPMAAGLSYFILSLSRKQDAKLSQVFSGFNIYGLCVGTYVLKIVFIFFWSLLLFIPGIIATLSYSMTYFIIADNNFITPLEAITKSKEMMRGNKWKFFCLGLRFVGWSLLCVFTFGIGFLWLVPYWNVSYAQFYDDLKEKN
ncbi:MAG: DUF975 family protein [Chlorobium sp.]|nr:MAG: DUF975 family protein [Chlorobium sp.]